MHKQSEWNTFGSVQICGFVICISVNIIYAIMIARATYVHVM